MKNRLIFLAVVLLSIGILTGGAFAADWKKIRVGTEGAYPPFNFIDEKGQLQGFDIDIAKALCEEMGAECEFVVQDWDGLIPGLLAKKYDCIIASMSITEDRKKKVDFTEKYYNTPARFVARKSDALELFKKGLKGKTVGAQRATVTEYFLRDNFSDMVKIKSYATIDEANLDLTAGRLDLVIADSVVLLGGLLEKPEGKDFMFVGPSFSNPKWFGEGIGIAIRKGSGNLAPNFNAAIKALRANGVYQAINKKYFDFDVYGD
jgi:arginine/ornithine transport system substrate-binding protein